MPIYGSIHFLNTLLQYSLWIMIFSGYDSRTESNLLSKTFSNFIFLNLGTSIGIWIILSKYSCPLICCTWFKASQTISLSIESKYTILGKLATCFTNWKISLICWWVRRSISSITIIIFLSILINSFSRVFLISSKLWGFVKLSPFISNIICKRLLIGSPTIGINDNDLTALEYWRRVSPKAWLSWIWLFLESDCLRTLKNIFIKSLWEE